MKCTIDAIVKMPNGSFAGPGEVDLPAADIEKFRAAGHVIDTSSKPAAKAKAKGKDEAKDEAKAKGKDEAKDEAKG
jgi:hypothetical protein